MKTKEYVDRRSTYHYLQEVGVVVVGGGFFFLCFFTGAERERAAAERGDDGVVVPGGGLVVRRPPAQLQHGRRRLHVHGGGDLYLLAVLGVGAHDDGGNPNNRRHDPAMDYG